jgi:carboxymethylenebutenolidase
MMERVELEARDGQRIPAWRCDPAGVPKGGVVVLHAIFGLTRRMGEVCARWAQAGYSAVAPALFARLGSTLEFPYTHTAPGIESYAALKPEGIFTDIEAAGRAAAPAGGVVISGFCTGGSWAWRAAAALPFLAQVNFYGSHIPELLDLVPRCPTLLLYGDADRIVSRPEIDRIRARHPGVTLVVYPGVGHAFENPYQSGYDAAAAARAWTRAVDFVDALRQPTV